MERTGERNKKRHRIVNKITVDSTVAVDTSTTGVDPPGKVRTWAVPKNFAVMSIEQTVESVDIAGHSSVECLKEQLPVRRMPRHLVHCKTDECCCLTTADILTPWIHFEQI